jgi:hypothetical protein
MIDVDSITIDVAFDGGNLDEGGAAPQSPSGDKKKCQVADVGAQSRVRCRLNCQLFAIFDKNRWARHDRKYSHIFLDAMGSAKRARFAASAGRTPSP